MATRQGRAANTCKASSVLRYWNHDDHDTAKTAAAYKRTVRLRVLFCTANTQKHGAKHTRKHKHGAPTRAAARRKHADDSFAVSAAVVGETRCEFLRFCTKNESLVPARRERIRKQKRLPTARSTISCLPSSGQRLKSGGSPPRRPVNHVWAGEHGLCEAVRTLRRATTDSQRCLRARRVPFTLLS